MFTITKKSIEWGGRTLEIESGRIARQATGAVYIKYGNTSMLCTAVANKEPKAGVDFFPLTVNYQEKAFAAGKIPGGYFKREGRPTEKETLVSRLIDRPIRPLFPENFYNETQVVVTLLSHDLENDPDVIAMVGASAALAISGIPFQDPIGAARVGFIDGEYVLNPTMQQMADSRLDLVVAATESSVMMVESEAKELTEEEMLGAVVFGHKHMQPVIKLINDFAKECGKPKWEVAKPEKSELEKRIYALGESKMRDAYKETLKQTRSQKLDALRTEITEALAKEFGTKEAPVAGKEPIDSNTVKKAIKGLEKDIVRNNILKTGSRIDGRDTKTVRPILAEVDFLPQTHGSALFTRGETQAIVVTTLGTTQDEQMIDALEGTYNENFMLHYNFPPYSVGEAGRMGSPGRREIGHGKLAWRAIHPMLPTKEQFPYTLRVVSEITESNGSSSMATVCGTSLSLMAAGVPLARPVAGIAMGLIKEGNDFAVLSDILGDEDHLGDMDFKVAGTEAGVTALQMDIKINGITAEIMKIALAQAKDGRDHILGKMNEALSGAREGLNENAPKISTMTVPKDKIREVIGSGGSVIRDIVAQSGAKVDINDDGVITIAAVKGHQAEKAIEMIKAIAAEVEVGTIYTGKVVRIVDFGAFVNLFGKTDGLVHISELKAERVGQVTDVVNEGDMVKVKVIGLDKGKIRLSMKVVDQNTGEDITSQFGENPHGEPRGERGDRGPRRDRGDRGDRGPRRDRDDDRGPRRERDDDRGNRDGGEYEDRPRKRRNNG